MRADIIVRRSTRLKGQNNRYMKKNCKVARTCDHRRSLKPPETMFEHGVFTEMDMATFG